MNGERCRAANLPFEPSMRRAVGRPADLIAILKKYNHELCSWQNEAKMINLFKEP